MHFNQKKLDLLTEALKLNTQILSEGIKPPLQDALLIILDALINKNLNKICSVQFGILLDYFRENLSRSQLEIRYISQLLKIIYHFPESFKTMGIELDSNFFENPIVKDRLSVRNNKIQEFVDRLPTKIDEEGGMTIFFEYGFDDKMKDPDYPIYKIIPDAITPVKFNNKEVRRIKIMTNGVLERERIEGKLNSTINDLAGSWIELTTVDDDKVVVPGPEIRRDENFIDTLYELSPDLQTAFYRPTVTMLPPDFWENVYAGRPEKEYEHDYRSIRQGLVVYFKNYLIYHPEIKEIILFEIGCGHAQTLQLCYQAAKELGINVVAAIGLDKDPSSIEFNKQHLVDDFIFEIADSLDIHDQLLSVFKKHGIDYNSSNIHVSCLSMGALNRLVLSGMPASITILQQLYALSDSFFAAGLTELLFTSSMAKAIGFSNVFMPTVENQPFSLMEGKCNEQSMKRLVKKHHTNSANYLDLSFCANVIYVLQELPDELCKQVKLLDLRWAFIDVEDDRLEEILLKRFIHLTHIEYAGFEHRRKFLAGVCRKINLQSKSLFSNYISCLTMDNINDIAYVQLGIISPFMRARINSALSLLGNVDFEVSEDEESFTEEFTEESSDIEGYNEWDLREEEPSDEKKVALKPCQFFYNEALSSTALSNANHSLDSNQVFDL